MKKLMLIPLWLALFVQGACGGSQGVLVIRDATVIDGTGAEPLPRSTVVIEAGRITAVGVDGAVHYPRFARVIDGRGKYLIPGLWDMHVHLRDLDGTLPLFLVNGVTSVRDMGSDLNATVELRRRVNTGMQIGPRVLTSGPVLESTSWLTQYVDLMREQGWDGEEVEEFMQTRVAVGTPSEAGEVVKTLTDGGADFIKIRHVESLEVFDAIVAAAREAGTHVAGHYVWRISLEESADGGQRSIEHNILPGFNERSPEMKRGIFDALLRNGTHVVPTLVTNAAETATLDELVRLVEDTGGAIDPRNRYVSASIREDWIDSVAADLADAERPPPEVIRRMIAGSNQFLDEARRAGVPMLAGTDVPARGTFFGFSLHDELELLVRTYEMTPMEALRSATALPAAFMGLEDDFGTIQTGMVADLVLLDADPLADISNTRRIDAVIFGGTIMERSERERVLRQIESGIGPSREGAASNGGG